QHTHTPPPKWKTFDTHTFTPPCPPTKPPRAHTPTHTHTHTHNHTHTHTHTTNRTNIATKQCQSHWNSSLERHKNRKEHTLDSSLSYHRSNPSSLNIVLPSAPLLSCAPLSPLHSRDH